MDQKMLKKIQSLRLKSLPGRKMPRKIELERQRKNLRMPRKI